jgi:two-component system, chemotaxis family, CheB/CheR fusion protein
VTLPKRSAYLATAAAPSVDVRPQAPRVSPDKPRSFPVVGIGASAGGLNACQKLLDALPAASGMAFVLVQHLDPTHESMMVELLASHTAMPVQQAAHGMILQPDQLYVIPPGAYLAVSDGTFVLSAPAVRHGARMPFDFLLRSLADHAGRHAAAIVLSGTGADGTIGVQAVHDKGGTVIAQDPAEAGYGGMARSAVLTGVVDRICPVAQIPAALHQWQETLAGPDPAATPAAPSPALDTLDAVIDLVRTRTPLDFSPYKAGTLRRRIERRMSLAAIAPDNMAHYLDVLRGDDEELALLSHDLLINVTSFFRDRAVFALLESTVIPALVQRHAAGNPIRVWIVGCSAGEEAYSLVMLFHEALADAKLHIKLQVFASDVDPDAVAFAREGQYPESIATDVSAARLARFFSRENGQYVVSPDLRAAVVFTVQDVLADAPFSRLDMVSCRNLLIYLRPEAQAKVISLLHFALAEDGILLLGNSESAGNLEGRFEAVAKAEKIYRHIGRSRPGELGFLIGGDGRALRPEQDRGKKLSRQAQLADLCANLVTQTFAPAAILINARHECLYTSGNTDRYLHVPPGPSTQDLFVLARPGLRVKLRSAVHQAQQKKSRVIISGGRIGGVSFSVDAQPVARDGEDLLLICFVENAGADSVQGTAVTRRDAPRVDQLEHELEATRTELQGAIANLEFSNDEQKALNEEALSIQEEYQSTNEELLTSKEELQSLNEELAALNNQLHETLERQRTTSNDLQNVLFSTDMATIFLDAALKIRFFTPATKSLFSMLPGDIGRPLADLNFVATDSSLLTDARTVLQTLAPLSREISNNETSWYIRRILPYRAQDNTVEGVVITYSDITERRKISEALRVATHVAEMANAAKSRFLAAASHDLRQPLQTMTLLQGLLAKLVQGDRAQKLVALLDETLVAMAGMLNTLLDINQIESGATRPTIVDFPVAGLLAQLRGQFQYHAQAQQLAFTAMPCSLTIRSDPRLLEQMIRNLLANAFKYTRHGRVLLGCRRHGGALRVEIWDTGIGIPESECQAIFEEYHQIDNPARERARGLGLGLSIVRRLGVLLGHTISVRSQVGRGSVFSIDVALAASDTPVAVLAPQPLAAEPSVAKGHARPTILAVEDDSDLSDLVTILLGDLGYRVTTTHDAATALALVAAGKVRPDLILADYNLPGGLNGLQMVARLRAELQCNIPTVILTGDISTDTLRAIEREKCALLSKPVRTLELASLIQRLLAPKLADLPAQATGVAAVAEPSAVAADGTPIIFIVDDDDHLREVLRQTLEADGQAVQDFATCEAFLAAYQPGTLGCLLVDAYLPGIDGMELLRRMHAAGHTLPAIMITGNSDVAMAVAAMKAGAADFIEKPVAGDELIASIARAIARAHDGSRPAAERDEAAARFAGLTERQRSVMDLVLAGHPSKNIAADLGISQRTVENHRASIMHRTGAKSLPALARLAQAAAWREPSETT